jgi:hypothetical protein
MILSNVTKRIKKDKKAIMKVNKPKGEAPSLIGSTLGSVRKCVVQRICSCNRCRGNIEKDIVCYEIAQLGGAFNNYKRYCDDCFRAIIEKTRADLNRLFIESGNQ